jgi:hypothetical protein
VIWLALGCQPGPGAFATSCPTGPTEPGAVRIAAVDCADQLLGDGEGRPPDTELASAWLHAIVRHPASALTMTGVGGGTLVDAAPWDGPDALREVAPIVGGGWLDVDTFTLDGDRLAVGGIVVPFPDEPAEGSGERREIAWVPDPDGPWLTADGADGLYVHVRGDAALLGTSLWTDTALVAVDGAVVADRGGAVRFAGTRLLVAPVADGVRWLPGAQQALQGAVDGERVRLLRHGELVGTVDVVDGAVDVDVPADIDGVQAIADGRAPSEVVPPARIDGLAVGGAGRIALGITGVDRPVAVDWSDRRGRSGRVVVPPEGEELDLGEGRYLLDFQAGPALLPRALDVEVPADGVATVGVELLPAFDPGDRVLVALPWPGDGDPTARISDDTALDAALAGGIGLVIVAPPDGIGTTAARPADAPWLRVIDGSTLVSRDGFSIVSWPWTANPKRAASGAIDPDGLDAGDALALMMLHDQRRAAVDLAWLAAAGPPIGVDPKPAFVRVDGVDGLDDWFAWLDAGIQLAPVGPLTWVDVGDLGAWNTADAEDGMIRGRACATSGPLLALTVAGARPGDVVDADVLTTSVTVGGELDHVRLVGTGGRELARWDGADGILKAVVRQDTGWIVAIGTSNTGNFAITGPVWIGDPSR